MRDVPRGKKIVPGQCGYNLAKLSISFQNYVYMIESMHEKKIIILKFLKHSKSNLILSVSLVISHHFPVFSFILLKYGKSQISL